jgi:hypothetical protein
MRPTEAPSGAFHTAGDERLKNRARDTKEQQFLDDPVASDPALRVSGVQARAERQASIPPEAAEARLQPLISIGAPAELSPRRAVAARANLRLPIYVLLGVVVTPGSAAG